MVEKSKKLTKVLRPILLALVLNHFSYPLASSAIWTSLIKKDVEKISVKSKELVMTSLAVEPLRYNLNAREYLNLASSLVSKNAEKWHVCRHYSVSVYKVYKDLIELTQRDELSDKVRIATSKIWEKEAHMWLEVFENDEWVSYESTVYTGKIPIEKIKTYSKKTRKTYSDLNAKVEGRYKTLPGTEFFLPTMKELWLSGGVIGAAFDSARHPGFN